MKKLEYHLYAKFPSNNAAARVGIFLSERKVREIGGEISAFANGVFYKLKPRRPGRKPYRKPKQ